MSILGPLLARTTSRNPLPFLRALSILVNAPSVSQLVNASRSQFSRSLHVSSPLLEDYYKTLGVSRDASQDDIKQAFRKLVKEYHPDLNKDTNTKQKMADINAAYDTLKDEETRRMYDFEQASKGRGGRGGPHVQVDGFGGFGGFGGFDMRDIFEAGSGHKSQQRAKTVQTLSITFMEAALGVHKRIQFKTLVKCTHCSGSGAAPGSKPVKCTTCKGQGVIRQIQGVFQFEMECRACDGQGKRITSPCKECHGEGQVKEMTSKDMEIPAGVYSGYRLDLESDVSLVIQVKNHEQFLRLDKDRNVHLQVPISLKTAILGGTIQVPTLAGQTGVDVPAGTQNSDTLVLKAKGFSPIKAGGPKGDQIIHFKVVLPQANDLSDADKALLDSKFSSATDDGSIRKTIEQLSKYFG